MQRFSLADMHAGALRVAERADATLAKEQAKAPGGDWHAAHVAGLKARAPRAVADALAEISEDL